jgi:RHS repeat-associated protein
LIIGSIQVGHILSDICGRVVESTVPLTLTDRLYTGQVFDASSGLYYYNARYYDPLVGQFTQPDSLVANPLNPAAWNSYGYVYGNPVNFTDPSGHVAIAPWDLLDVVSFGVSFNDFVRDPSLANAGWLALDTISLLPLIPAFGAIHHAGKLDEVGDAAKGMKQSSPVRIFVDPNGRAIPQLEEGTLFRVTAVTPDIDEAITRQGFLTGQARGVTEGQLSRLASDAPLEDRIIEYVVPEGGGRFPRNTNFIGLRADPGEAIRIAQGSGRDILARPGAYLRLDEIRVYPWEVIDPVPIFKSRGLRPKHPPLQGELIFEGSISPNRIVNTIRFRP